MKHNMLTNKNTRQANRVKGKSKYAQKVQGGNQMYGPGCCAHDYPEARIAANRERLMREGWFRNPIFPRQRQNYADDVNFALPA